MSTTTGTTNRTRRHASTIVALLIAAAMVLVAATDARAATGTAAANYTAGPVTQGDGTPFANCHSWSGDADDNGHFYFACPGAAQPFVYETDPTGKIIRTAALPPEYLFDRMRDVGASPDGNTLYVSMGPIVDKVGANPGAGLNNGAMRGAVLRLKRSPDGNWAYDPAFRSGPYKFGDDFWAARDVDVDAAGRPYVTVNGTVMQIDPTSGQYVTYFGGGATTNGPGGPWIDGIDVAQGIAVSADGNTIYVVEQQHHLVQRWLRVGATNWQRDATFLLGTPDFEDPSACQSNTKFLSPYDVSLDVAGDIYVTDTTCRRIQRFTNAGVFVQTVWSEPADGELPHGTGVSWNGSIVIPEQETILIRKDPPAKPEAKPTPTPECTDKSAPAIATVSASKLVTTRAVKVTITGTDDCKGITAVRVSGSINGTAKWSTGTTQTVSLSGWNGVKLLTIVARDGANRVSVAKTLKVSLALPQPKLVARKVAKVAGTGCSKSAPASRISGGYRLIDRCARLVGTVLKIQKQGRGFAAQILLPTGAAQQLYTNAVGPVKIWVVTDSKTRVAKQVRTGHKMTFVGSLVAEMNLSQVHGIPADIVTGS